MDDGVDQEIGRPSRFVPRSSWHAIRSDSRRPADAWSVLRTQKHRHVLVSNLDGVGEVLSECRVPGPDHPTVRWYHTGLPADYFPNSRPANG